MNLWLISGLICVGVGALVLGVLFAKKYATLRVLDPNTSRTLREKKLRDRIMEDRMQRTVQMQMDRVVHAVLVPWRALQYAFQRLAGKLVAIERRYHREHVREVNISPEELQSMLAEAERALRDERFQVAEERLVELISAAPKCAPAYELFSRVYAAKREWKEAVESLLYYVKLAPKDGDRRFLLGAMYEKQGEQEKAYAEYVRAVDASPHNPKYLDAAIELAFDLKKYEDAERMIAALQEANPDNAKIAQFIERIAPFSQKKKISSSPSEKRQKK